MRDLVLTLFIVGMLPMIFTQPHLGVLVWSWLGYMNPHRMTWGFAYSFPFVQLVALVTIAALFVSKEPKRFPWTPITVTWLAFIFWMTLTTVTALDTELAWPEWQRMIKTQMLVGVTLLVITNKERLNLLVWVVGLSIAFFGIKGGVFTLLTGGKYLVWGPPKSFIAGNNEIAFAILLSVPLLRYLQVHAPNKWVRRALAVGMALCLVAVAGSYSRGAFLAAGAMLIFLWLRTRRKALTGTLLAIVAAGTIVFMPAEWTDRMSTIQTYEEDGSAMGRINAWTFAFNLANSRPLVGGGFDTFTQELFQLYAPNPDNWVDAHSIFFEVLGEHGYPGLLLFVGMGIGVLVATSRIARRTKDREELRWARDLALMLQVSFVGYGVGGAFLGLAYFDLPYHLMAMVVLLGVIVDRELAGESSPATARAGRARPRPDVRSPPGKPAHARQDEGVAT